MTNSFTQLKAIAAPLPMDNVNTEVISPKDLMRAVTRKGLSWGLFRPYRFEENGEENPDFILNKQPWRQAQIIVTLANFGCGSSREHAVWALTDFGIRCIIALSFADIFLNNCLKNRLLPVVLPRAEIDRLMEAASRGAEIEVNLEQLTVGLPGGETFDFSLNELHRHRLLHGIDDIAETLRHLGEIESFEQAHLQALPWLRNGTSKVNGK